MQTKKHFIEKLAKSCIKIWNFGLKSEKNIANFEILQYIFILISMIKDKIFRSSALHNWLMQLDITFHHKTCSRPTKRPPKAGFSTHQFTQINFYESCF